jgi:hypothetical protein
MVSFIQNYGGSMLPSAVFVAVVMPLSAIVSGAENDTCVTAFQAILDAEQFGMMSGPCSIADSTTLEQLETEICPVECQSLYDAVLDNCTPGIDVYQSFEVEDYINVYQEAVLYHLQGYNWKSCNYGYQPTACDEALDNLKVSILSNSDWYHSAPRPVPAACAVVWDDAGYVANDADEPCAADCKIYIDAVVQACDANPDATFAPDSFYFMEENHQRIPWESPRAVQFREINTPPMSESCFMYYTDAAAAINPKFGTEDSMPPFGSEACQNESKSLNRFELGNIYRALLLDSLPSCLVDDLQSSERCDVNVTDAALSDYQTACEKAGGKMLTFDLSLMSCFGVADSFYRNLPTCVGKSCDDQDVCEAAADHEGKALGGDPDDPACNTTTTCRTSSARLGRVLGRSTFISSAGVVCSLWAALF